MSVSFVPSEKVDIYPAMSRYQAFVKDQCSLNPSLLGLFNFLSNNPKTYQNECHVVAMDFQANTDHPSCRPIQTLDHLHSQLQSQPRSHLEDYNGSRVHNYRKEGTLLGRILIIEDLTKDVVELLGYELDIDPLFFAMHLHTAQKKGMYRQSPDTATLPSRILSKDFINTNYHRAISFDKEMPSGSRLLRDSVIDRKVVVLPSTTIGLAQHCASILRVKQRNGAWIGARLTFL